MAEETITTHKTVEEDVTMSVCDDCGEHVGPTHDEDTRLVPIITDPKIEQIHNPIQITHNILNSVSSRDKWISDGPGRDGSSKSRTIMRTDSAFLDGKVTANARYYMEKTGMQVHDKFDPFYVRNDVLKEAADSYAKETGPTEISGSSIKEVCLGCAPEYGYDVDYETGDVSPVTLIDRSEESEDEEDDEQEETDIPSSYKLRMAYTSHISFIVGFAWLLLHMLALTEPGSSLPFGVFPAVILVLIGHWTQPPS